MTRYRAEDLQAYAAALLAGGGFAPVHAEQTASVLVWANARGADSHGVLRIPRYIEMVEEGTIDPVAMPEVKSNHGAVSILEADGAPGASSMMAAMDEAVEIAGRLGIGWCSARNITHAGAVGYYTLQAARRGYIGVVMTASGPLMAYHGARVSGVSTNPISIAVPSAGNPLLLDMSTSNAALGKIMAAKDAGRPIPESWGIDSDGAPTTDPHRVATLTPLGGPKGSGLSLMIEILASLLVSNPVISEALSGRPATMNGLALALNIQAFADPDVFAKQIAELVASIKGLPAANGTEAILMPGERGFAMADVRTREGIPISSGTLRRLAELSEKLGVSEPTPLEAISETRPAAP